jgi:hypothetical protein
MQLPSPCEGNTPAICSIAGVLKSESNFASIKAAGL